MTVDSTKLSGFAGTTGKELLVISFNKNDDKKERSILLLSISHSLIQILVSVHGYADLLQR